MLAGPQHLAVGRVDVDTATGQRSGPGFVIGCTVVLLLAEAPLLWKFFVDLWSRPQYEFFPLLLAAVPFVALGCLRDTPAADVRPGSLRVGILLWATALACLAVGGVLYLKWFAPVSAWLVLAGAVWLLGGRGLAKGLWPVGALLLLILPPPGQYDGSLLVTLRHMAVACAGRLLTLLGVPLHVHGAVIDIPGDRLMVEEACSGINSMLAVLAFTVLLAFWKRLPLRSLLLLLPAGFAFVFWANVARITLCATAKVWWGLDLLVGAPHELLGLLLFVTCMALVFSTERIAEYLLGGEALETHATPTAAAGTPPGAPIAPRRAIVFGVAAIVFGLVGAFTSVRTWHAWPTSVLPTAEALRMPETLAGWTRVQDKDAAPERAEVSGRQSRLWQYRCGALLATIGVDYPFSGYHDATICYASAGWTLTDTRENPPQGEGPARFDVTMVRPPLSQGLMAFALCDEAGVWWRRPAPVGQESVLAQKLRLSKSKALSPPLAQLQVLHVGFDPPSAAERRQLADLFSAAADALNRQIKGFRAAP